MAAPTTIPTTSPFLVGDPSGQINPSFVPWCLCEKILPGRGRSHTRRRQGFANSCFLTKAQRHQEAFGRAHDHPRNIARFTGVILPAKPTPPSCLGAFVRKSSQAVVDHTYAGGRDSRIRFLSQRRKGTKKLFVVLTIIPTSSPILSARSFRSNQPRLRALVPL